MADVVVPTSPVVLFAFTICSMAQARLATSSGLCTNAVSVNRRSSCCITGTVDPNCVCSVKGSVSKKSPSRRAASTTDREALGCAGTQSRPCAVSVPIHKETAMSFPCHCFATPRNRFTTPRKHCCEIIVLLIRGIVMQYCRVCR